MKRSFPGQLPEEVKQVEEEKEEEVKGDIKSPSDVQKQPRGAPMHWVEMLANDLVWNATKHGLFHVCSFLTPKDMKSMLIGWGVNPIVFSRIAEGVWDTLMRPETLVAAALNRHGGVVEELLSFPQLPDPHARETLVKSVRNILELFRGDKIVQNMNSFRDQLWTLVGNELGFDNYVTQKIHPTQTQVKGLSSLLPNVNSGLTLGPLVEASDDVEANDTCKEEWIVSICYVKTSDAEYIAGGSSLHVVRLYDVSSGEPVRNLVGHSSTVSTVSHDPIHPEILWSGSDDQTVKKWLLGADKCIETIGPFQEWVSCIQTRQVSNMTELFVSLHNGDIFKMTVGEDATTIPDVPLCSLAESDPITSFTFANCKHSKPYLIVGSGAGKVLLIDADSGETLQAFEGHTSDAFPASSSPMPSARLCIASCSYDMTVRLWSFEDSVCTVLEGHDAPLRSCTWLVVAGRTFLASCSSDGAVFVWDPLTSTCLADYYIPTHLIDIITLPDSSLAVSSSEGTIYRLAFTL